VRNGDKTINGDNGDKLSLFLVTVPRNGDNSDYNFIAVFGDYVADMDRLLGNLPSE